MTLFLCLLQMYPWLAGFFDRKIFGMYDTHINWKSLPASRLHLRHDKIVRKERSWAQSDAVGERRERDEKETKREDERSSDCSSIDFLSKWQEKMAREEKKERPKDNGILFFPSSLLMLLHTYQSLNVCIFDLRVNCSIRRTALLSPFHLKIPSFVDSSRRQLKNRSLVVVILTLHLLLMLSSSTKHFLLLSWWCQERDEASLRRRITRTKKTSKWDSTEGEEEEGSNRKMKPAAKTMRRTRCTKNNEDTRRAMLFKENNWLTWGRTILSSKTRCKTWCSWVMTLFIPFFLLLQHLLTEAE